MAQPARREVDKIVARREYFFMSINPVMYYFGVDVLSGERCPGAKPF